MIARTVWTAAAVLVAIITTPYALVPVANSADAVVVVAILAVPAIWLWPPAAPRRAVSPYFDDGPSRLDRLEADGLAKFERDERAEGS